jgi:ADP-ribose pyrophosphatase
MNDNTKRLQWQGKSWRLMVEQIEAEDGSTVERGYVDHPGAVVLVPVRGEQVLMLRQYRFALEQTILELPAGTRDPDEDWLACAQRELREETGLRADNLIPLGRVWPAPGLSNEVMALYLATNLTASPLPADDDEIIEIEWLALSHLVQMALEGQIQDGKSVIGILRAAQYLKRLA